MEELHRRLLQVGFSAGDDLGLVLAGGYALTAHELLQRPSQDIDFATATPLPLPEVADRLVAAYQEAGYAARIIEATPRMARLMVSAGADSCEVDLLKEAIGPPAQLSIGPVVALDDAVGLKMRALHDRAAHRDYIDVHAASAILSWHELETRGARHTPGFTLEELADRLGAIAEREERIFASYGLGEEDVAGLRRWAAEWESDIRERIAAGEDAPAGAPDSEWDAYLDGG
jgi:hypothetical protein